MKAFHDVVTQTPVDILMAALQIARLVAYADLDVPAYLSQIEQLARQAVDADVAIGSDAVRAESLVKFLYEQSGLKGNVDNYGDPRNSFLNDVMERGLGIPITLSIIYTAVAQRLGLHAYGVGLPGHFVVGVGESSQTVFIDPFNGAKLNGRECARLVRETTGYTGVFKPEWLLPTPAQDVIVRLLNNLRIAYMRDEEWPFALRVLNLLEVAQPQLVTVMRDKALIAFAQGDYYAASKLLEKYLESGAVDAEAVALKRAVAPQLSRWASLN